jgi:K+-sensing histidine kinase KdpD
MRWRIRPSAEALRSVPSWLVASACLAGTALIGLLDSITGDDVVLTLFYLLPISIATWFVRARLGVALSLAAAAIYCGLNLARHLAGRPVPVQSILWNSLVEFVVFLAFALTLSELRAHLAEERQAKQLAQEALALVKKLSALLPMCSSCKKVRDAAGIWEPFDSYLLHHTGTQVTHGMCPACLIKLYPEQYRRLQEKQLREGG